MSEPARNRFALDLEDLERQLRGAAQPPKPGQANDPLAELTRIVGQDDPLKELFAPRQQPVAAPVASQPVQLQGWPGQRDDEAFDPTPERQPANEGAPPAELRGALDEFEALLRRTEGGRPAPEGQAVYVPQPDDAYDAPTPQGYARPASVQGVTEAPRDLDQDAQGYDYAYAQDERDGAYGVDEPPQDDMPALRPRRSRKGLWTAAAMLAVGVIGVSAAMTFRASTTTSDGRPLVITAETGPTKVEPDNPGGADIPNQNKQIYERAGQVQPAKTNVVSREEQPVDVQQAARSLSPRIVLPGPGSTGTASDASANPIAQAPAAPERSLSPIEPQLQPVPPVPGLGEPRRVRTVSIRPDGTPVPASNGNGNGSAALVTGSTQQGDAPRAQRAAATPEPTTMKVQERVGAPAPATTPPLRIASAAPQAAAPAPTATTATAAIRSGTGDFAVQLAAPGSESEARATFSALQRKYPELLGGQPPIVRKTDLAGGKTVYRLRVGPYTRENATTMCTQLQAAGGQCFIAKN